MGRCIKTLGIDSELFLSEVDSGSYLVLHSKTQYEYGRTQTDANPDMIEREGGGEEEPDNLG